MPVSPFLRNVLKVVISRKGDGCGFFSPSRHTRKSIGAVAKHGQVVRNRLRLHTELGHHAGLVAQDVAPAVQLNNSRANDALAEIFVRGANDHLPYTVIPRSL